MPLKRRYPPLIFHLFARFRALMVMKTVFCKQKGRIFSVKKHKNGRES